MRLFPWSKTAKRSLAPRGQTLFNSGNGNTNSGEFITADNALEASAVYACVRVLSESIAQLPLLIYTQNGKSKDRAGNDPLYRLLSGMPNSYQNSFEWREMLMAHLTLRGNAYCKIEIDGGGNISQLIPLHPDRVLPFKTPDGSVAYKYQPQVGGAVIYLQNEIFHIRGLSTDGVVGLNPISLHRESIGLSQATEKHGAELFKNGAQPGGLLVHPGKMTEDSYKNLRKSWEERYQGAGKAHKTVILEEGMTYDKLAMTPEDSQFLQTRQFQVTDIARIFRVPPHKIGDLSQATFSNIEQQSIDFVQDTLLPWLKRWETAIDTQLIGEAKRSSLFSEFKVEGLLRGDSAARSAFYASGIQNGWLTRNEVRALENLNPIDGGDIPLVPLNLGTMDALTQEEQPEAVKDDE